MSNIIKVLVDGVFDPLHDGHIEYLQNAAKYGNCLIVNIASDEEIWIKRPSIGPLLPLNARIKVISNLKPVDEVVIFETRQALTNIKPSVYIKGIDWQGRLPKIEQEICQELNIQVIFLSTMLNSSSLILENFIKQLK